MTSSLHELSQRLDDAAETAQEVDIDALLITPSADLGYLCGYNAKPLERLTCLVITPDRTPVLIVPLLERAAAQASLVGDLPVDVMAWSENDDPYALIAKVLPSEAKRIGLDNHMWAERVLALRIALPNFEQVLAGSVLSELRMRKSPGEIDALREAGAAIDRVHARMGEWLRPGRTELEVGTDIAAAIIAEGHVTADFVIVGSGPHGASPHHELSDRVIQAGEPVVVDIGGTTRAGYCSDSTRTYAMGSVPDEFQAYYAVLLAAQTAACDAVTPGVTCESIDAAARDIIDAAGYGKLFFHRTGHGIGLETHEDPYIVRGNTLPLEAGMAFSVEPGIYEHGKHGARIEDIVICTETGGERLNLRPRELVVLDA